MDSNFVLLLQEVRYHPNSYLKSLHDRFEITSIANITRKDELRKYAKPPLFEDKYLILFDDVKVFENNKAFISFKTMFIVVCVENSSQLDDAKFVCNASNIPYKIYNNAFSSEDAFALIRNYSNETELSDNFCKALVKQVGLNPLRILTALDVCQQLGYSVSVIEKYVDKWMFPGTRKLIECLLNIERFGSDRATAALYLHINRHWYRYTRSSLVDELEIILEVYRDKISGALSSDNLFEYIDSKRIPRSKVMYALNLFEKANIASIYALKEFIRLSSLMEVALKLSKG